MSDTVLQAATLVVFPALMTFAAFSDLLTMTISNRLSLILLSAFPVFAVAAGLGAWQVGLHLACGACVLALTFAMFALRWIGGGDAKLAAATAVWIGFDHLADYGLETALLGGLLTMAILSLRHYPLPAFMVRVGWLERLHQHGAGVPYGIALAAAGLLVYPETGLFAAVAGA